MCAVSMVSDHYLDRWQRRTNDFIWPQPLVPTTPLVTQEELDEFRRLLERAREYDRQHNQPDCELDEKRQALKKLADQLGVETNFL